MAMFNILLVLIMLQNCCQAATSDKADVIASSSKLKLDVFYSPLHVRSAMLIRKVITPVMWTDLSSYVQLKMYPVANCKFAESNLVSPLSCNNREDVSTLTVEHICAFQTISQGSKMRHADEQQIMDKIWTLEALDYIKCTTKDETLTVAENIHKCRSDLSVSRANGIQDCISKKARNYCTEAMKLYRKYDPKYFPFFVVNGTQNKKQDREGMSNLIQMICKNLQQKPHTCKYATTLVNQGVTIGDGNKDTKVDSKPVYEHKDVTTPSSSQSYSVRPCFLVMITLILFLLIHKISLLQ